MENINRISLPWVAIGAIILLMLTCIYFAARFIYCAWQFTTMVLKHGMHRERTLFTPSKPTPENAVTENPAAPAIGADHIIVLKGGCS